MAASVLDVLNMVRFVTATVGTADFVAGAAYSSAFLTEVDAGAVDQKQYSYVVTDNAGGDIEEGWSVYTASTRTFTRNVVKSKIGGSVGTTKLTLSGSATVRITPLARDLQPLLQTPVVADAAQTLTAAQTKQVADNVKAVSYDTTAQALSTTQKSQVWKNISQPTLSKSANYTVAATDNAASIQLTGAGATLSFTAAATLGDTFFCEVKNDGSGDWTLDPNSTEQINGATTLTLKPGEGAVIWCTGAAFNAIGNFGSVRYDISQSLSAAQQQQARANIGINAASLARSSNTILALADHGALVKATGTFTQTFTAAATLGDKWRVFYRNDGTGVITLDPNGSETVNGATTWKLYPGEAVDIICDGANFFTVGDAARILLDTQTASSSAQLDFVRFDSNRFSAYIFEFEELLPATSNTSLQVLISTDGGSTFFTTAIYNYARLGVVSGASFAVDSLGDTKFVLAASIGSTASRGLSASLNTHNSANQFGITWIGTYNNDTPSVIFTSGTGNLNTTAAVNALRFKFAAGNITSGTIRMYGIR